MSEEQVTQLAEELDAKATGEKIREMVEAEATVNETETPEDEEGDGTDEPEAMPDDPLTLALAEYVGKIMDILGPDAPIKPCAYCQGKGFNPIELQSDTHSTPCDACNGFGEVTTGSKVQGNEARMCQDCHGAGYITETAPLVMPTGDTAGTPPRVLSEAEVAEIVRQAQEQAATFAT